MEKKPVVFMNLDKNKMNVRLVTTFFRAFRSKGRLPEKFALIDGCLQCMLAEKFFSNRKSGTAAGEAETAAWLQKNAVRNRMYINSLKIVAWSLHISWKEESEPSSETVKARIALFNELNIFR